MGRVPGGLAEICKASFVWLKTGSVSFLLPIGPSKYKVSTDQGEGTEDLEHYSTKGHG